MNPEITIVVPYYNESDNIELTLELIAEQSIPAKIAIFVNSSSTDDSSSIVDRWIGDNQHKFKTEFENVFKNTRNPGSSKNVGIRRARTKWIAFMDCGQNFDKQWLEKQINFVNSKSLDVSFGVVYLTGSNWIDRCAISQTYGYKKNCPCVPSTLVKKKVFDKTGMFLEGRRAGYDMVWQSKVRKIIRKYSVNKDVYIEYQGVNFADTINGLFNKSVMYARSALGLEGYYMPYYYTILFLLLLLMLKYSYIVFISAILSYLFLRAFIIPIFKSGNLVFYKEHPFESFLGLGLVGLTIDLGKLVGYCVGFSDFFKNNNSNKV